MNSRCVVVHDMEVFVPNIVATTQNGNLVDVLVAGIGRFGITVTEASNEAQKARGFKKWI